MAHSILELIVGALLFMLAAGCGSTPSAGPEISEETEEDLSPREKEALACLEKNKYNLEDDYMAALECIQPYQDQMGNPTKEGCAMLYKGQYPCGDAAYYQHQIECGLMEKSYLDEMVEYRKQQCPDPAVGKCYSDKGYDYDEEKAAFTECSNSLLGFDEDRDITDDCRLMSEDKYPCDDLITHKVECNEWTEDDAKDSIERYQTGCKKIEIDACYERKGFDKEAEETEYQNCYWALQGYGIDRDLTEDCKLIDAGKNPCGNTITHQLECKAVTKEILDEDMVTYKEQCTQVKKVRDCYKEKAYDYSAEHKVYLDCNAALTGISSTRDITEDCQLVSIGSLPCDDTIDHKIECGELEAGEKQNYMDKYTEYCTENGP